MVTRSYAPLVRTLNDPKFYGNAIRLPSRAEAEGYAVDLSGRWLLVVDWKVVESEEEPNYRWNPDTGFLEALIDE